MKNIAPCFLLSASFLVFSPSVKADNEMPNLSVEYYGSSDVRKFAAAQFLPEAQESEIGFSGNTLNGDYNQNNCSEYKYTQSNCPSPKVLSTPCSSDKKRFKKCTCDPQKFIYSSTNCIYKAEAPFYPEANRLLSDTCRNEEASSLLAQECNCKYFRYTTNASCGDANKVIDARSYCQENDGEIRYEACMCDRVIYPFLFKGNFHSQDFLDDVRINCGNEKNFISCQNFENETSYKCAVSSSYKYDDASCAKENTMFGATGASTSFINGYGDQISLYKECDCPSTYGTSCDGNSGSRFYAKDGKSLECRRRRPKCSFGFFKGMDDKGLNNCAEKIHGSIIRIGSSCIKKDGTEVYRCECRYRKGNWDYQTNFCGTCSNITEHVYCLENGESLSNSCMK